MLKLNKVSAGYMQEVIVKDINLTLKAGKVSVILGENGCGKSTLLKTIVKLTTLHAGELFFENQLLIDMSSQEIAQKIAYLPQGKKPADISVRKMVLHGRFPYLSYPRRYKKEDYQKVEEVLKRMEIETLADKNLRILSGGMQQKVFIAMALAQDTPMILMDEPTTHLDVSHQIKVLEIIKDLARQGKTIGIVLHDIAQALRYGDEIIVMKEGKIVACGDSDTLFENKVIDKVFNITLHRIKTEEGWQYYYES